jgi:hypothetical protein
MGETLRNLNRKARTLRTGGGREGRLGRALIVLGLVLIVIAVLGAIAVNL